MTDDVRVVLWIGVKGTRADKEHELQRIFGDNAEILNYTHLPINQLLDFIVTQKPVALVIDQVSPEEQENVNTIANTLPSTAPDSCLGTNLKG